VPSLGVDFYHPNPLPPSLTIDPALAVAAANAHGALGELKGLGRMLLNPHLLIRPFIRREAVLSSRIEGTQASVADRYAFEAGQLALPGIGTGAPEADVREVLNYVAALDHGLERIESLPVAAASSASCTTFCSPVCAANGLDRGSSATDRTGSVRRTVRLSMRRSYPRRSGRWMTRAAGTGRRRAGAPAARPST
jgi:hypothetical protein